MYRNLASENWRTTGSKSVESVESVGECFFLFSNKIQYIPFQLAVLYVLVVDQEKKKKLNRPITVPAGTVDVCKELAFQESQGI